MLAESFYYVKYGVSIITIKVRQIVSVKKRNTEKLYHKNSSFGHFDSRSVLNTTKTPVFVFITAII